MENSGNIAPICKECAEGIKNKTQRELPRLAELVGKYVKKRFEEGNKAEHMWVNVKSANEESGTLMGTLDNDPVVVTNVSLNDEVVVYREEIEAVLNES